MTKKFNLSNGFWFPYDWLPAIEALPGKEVKALLLALIALQREQKPLPIFKNKTTAIYAKMMEPLIRRRLSGAAIDHKEPISPEAPCPPTTPPNKEEESKAKFNNALAPRSVEEDNTGAREPTSPPSSALSEEEKESLMTEAEFYGAALTEAERGLLRTKGIPATYITERELRATKYAISHCKTAFTVLLAWWQEDAGNTSKELALQQRKHGFDADQFFTAALEKTYAASSAEDTV